MRENPPRVRTAAPPPESEPTAPAPEQGPIVMVNPVLNRIAGLPEEKKIKEKAATRRKSISEGGDVYIPKSFERIGDEVPLPAPEAAPATPETARELHARLASTVNAFSSVETMRERAWLEAQIPELERQLEAEQKSGKFKLSDRFRVRPSMNPEQSPLVEESLENRLNRYQARLTSLRELPQPAPVIEVAPTAPTVPLAANDAESLSAQPANPSERARAAVGLVRARQERRAAGLSPRNQRVYGKAVDAWKSGGKNKKGKGLRNAIIGFMTGVMTFTGLNVTGTARAEGSNTPAAAERVVQKEAIESKKISIDKPNEGADKLMQDFRANIQAQYPNADAQPPIVKAVLAPRTPHMLSLAFGFVSKDGISSRVMHMGDSIEIKDGKLVFTPHGKSEQVLLAQNTDGTLSEPNPIKEKLVPTHHHHLRHHVEHHSVHKEAAPAQPLHADSTKVSSSYTPAPSAPAAPPAPVSTPVPTMAPRDAASPQRPYAVPKPPYAAETPQAASPTIPVAPSAPATAREAASAAPTAAPKLETASQPTAAETAPTAPKTSESASEAERFNKPGATHFVTGTAEPILNSSNVDLNKVQMLKAGGHLFAHGRNTEENSEMADRRSKELLKGGAKPDDTVVYFLAYPDDRNSHEPVVRALFMPGPNQESQIVVTPNMPSVPKNDDYQTIQ